MTQRSDWKRRDPRFKDEAGRYEHPIPSRDFITKTLGDAGRPMSTEELAGLLGVADTRDQRALAKRLGAMLRDGQLLENRAGELCLLDRLTLIVGTVQGHKDGFGFLIPDGGGDDVLLPYRQMRELMHGDRAAVRVSGRDARGRVEGILVEVLERRTKEVAGQYWLEGGVGFVVPDNRRISHRVVVPQKQSMNAKSGQYVVAAIEQPPSKHADPLGRVTRILPEGGTAPTAIELAIVAHGLPHEFSAAVVREARRYGRTVREEDHAGREDLRALPLVTIDGEDARDFDDAVYAEETRNGYRLLVAIADVSHYVQTGSALDTEARERATSVYFPNRVLPMLPEALSNHLCSLMPEVDRLCMVCDMSIARTGKVSRTRFYPAVMRSQARLTYTRVATALVERNPVVRQELGPLVERLECLHDVYRALRRNREARGALDFEAPEMKLVVNEAGEVTEMRAYPRNDAHRLIEECMIAANVEAARFLKKHKLPSLFRIHGKPDEDRLAELKRFLAERGVALDITGVIEPGLLARTLAQIAGRPDAAVLETSIIRSLPQALYQPENIGHFGLALDEYAHFTSPIRRYPDLLVHRGIRHGLDGGRPEAFVYSPRAMEQLGSECSLRERRADEACRDVVQTLKCEFMRSRIGEEFDAVVTGVTDFGAFVQLKGLQIDGLVHVTSLGSDYFRFYENDRTLVGERTKLRIAIGDELRVQLVRVDAPSRKIDFALVGRTAEHHHPRRAAKRGKRR